MTENNSENASPSQTEVNENEHYNDESGSRNEADSEENEKDYDHENESEREASIDSEDSAAYDHKESLTNSLKKRKQDENCRNKNNPEGIRYYTCGFTFTMQQIWFFKHV